MSRPVAHFDVPGGRFELFFRQRLAQWLVRVKGAQVVVWRVQPDVAQHRRVLQHHAHAQGLNDIDDGDQVFFLLVRDREGLVPNPGGAGISQTSILVTVSLPNCEETPSLTGPEAKGSMPQHSFGAWSCPGPGRALRAPHGAHAGAGDLGLARVGQKDHHLDAAVEGPAVHDRDRFMRTLQGTRGTAPQLWLLPEIYRGA